MVNPPKQIKISIIGSRGIPAKYGGFESFTEDLSQALLRRGYVVTVCCEYTGSEKVETFNGVHLRYFPLSPPNSYVLRKIYEIINDIYFIALLSRTQDILYILGVGTAGWFTFFPKILNIKIRIVINIDGLEWKRGKFSVIERSLLRINNYLAMRFADITIIDSKSLEKYIDIGKRKTIFIPYGIESIDTVSWDNDKLKPLSDRIENVSTIIQDKYWLVVARLEPENNIHIIIEGYLSSNSKMPLCIIGDYTSKKYMASLSKLKDNNRNAQLILFLGPIYDKTILNMLRQNCFVYIHGHSVGGTNPSLLEAMSMKNIILAHGNEFNREVGGKAFIYFENSKDLSEKMIKIEENKTAFDRLKRISYQRVIKNYDLENIFNQYDKLFKNI